jgi:hypothetical protein
MAHIQLPEGIPGILGPMSFRPETAKPLNELAEVLLRGAEFAFALRSRTHRHLCFLAE